MSDFQPKTFIFDTDVKVIVNEDAITATSSNGSAKIESKNLDNISYLTINKARLSAFALIARTFGAGFILLLFVGSETRAMFFKANALQILLFYSAMLLFLVSIVAFFAHMIDYMAELGLYDKLIGHYFSYRGYAVKIANKSGNNIDFVANEDELEKIKSLEKKLDELKQHKEANPLIAPHQQSNTSLDELKKLGDLYQSGILTKDEFDKKKTELLNK